jgi:hypothetical protein
VTEIAGDHCGLHAWTNQSTVAHATSATAMGPYKKQGVAVQHQAHNPQTIKIGDAWYIFHIGSANSKSTIQPCNETLPPFTHESTADDVSIRPGYDRGTHQGGSTLHRATSPAGPFLPVSGGPGGNNPSPFLHPNGTLFLADTWTLRSAPRPEGPWSNPIQLEPFDGSGRPNGAWEDPFLVSCLHCWPGSGVCICW